MLGLKEAGTTEEDTNATTPVIVLVSCPVDLRPEEARRLSGRLNVEINPKSLSFQAYGKRKVSEVYNCNYELNPEFRGRFEAANLTIGGTGDNGEVRIIELPDHRFFLATAFQPQMSSTRERPHPLFVAYLRACAQP